MVDMYPSDKQKVIDKLKKKQLDRSVERSNKVENRLIE